METPAFNKFVCWGMIRFTESFTVVSGVVQLLNKMDGRPFNQNDENLFEVNICLRGCTKSYGK